MRDERIDDIRLTIDEYKAMPPLKRLRALLILMEEYHAREEAMAQDMGTLELDKKSWARCRVIEALAILDEAEKDKS